MSGPRPLCLRCEEPITPAEQTANFVAGQPLHYECGLRMAVGSVAHIEGRCSCVIPGAEEHDDPALTIRQAALAAVTAWHAKLRGATPQQAWDMGTQFGEWVRRTQEKGDV